MERRVERELIHQLAKLTDVAEGIQRALQKLVDEPLVEVEPAPAQCPNCGKINPTVVDNSEEHIEELPIGEVVFTGTCKNCNHPIYAVPTQWVVHGDRNEAATHLQEIIERNKINV